MKNQYAYNTETGLVLRLENVGWINANEDFIYSDELLNLKHLSGVEMFKVVEGEIIEREKSEIESDLKYKNWVFETSLKAQIKADYLLGYGSWGKLGAVLAHGKVLLSNPNNAQEWTDELRFSENFIDMANSENILYYPHNLTEEELGLVYVEDINQDVILQTKELPVDFEEFVVGIVATFLECGYGFGDILFEYKKSSGDWSEVALHGKKPYSVVAKVTDASEGNISFRLTLSAGNATKTGALVSFGLVGL